MSNFCAVVFQLSEEVLVCLHPLFWYVYHVPVTDDVLWSNAERCLVVITCLDVYTVFKDQTGNFGVTLSCSKAELNFLHLLLWCLHYFWLTVAQFLSCCAMQYNEQLPDHFYPLLRYLHYVQVKALQLLGWCVLHFTEEFFHFLNSFFKCLEYT